MNTFADLGLVEPLRRALVARGYATPTPIQVAAIPPLLRGKDVLGVAQTGTGKTAAFVLPILQHIAHTRARRTRPIRALVLCPTRELARQIGISVGRYGRFLDIHHTVLYGGTPEPPQVQALARGVDIVVATPGRLIDLHRR
ncbi:MAG: ATP-dependent RNA helicase RhlE, partial [Myxococcota bacterium]